MDSPTLYLVFLAPDPGVEALALEEVQPLGSGLYLAGSARTRSQLYHLLKRRTQPRQLLVAPLADHPKSKGMAPGTLAWLRARAGADALSPPAKPAVRSPARRRR